MNARLRRLTNQLIELGIVALLLAAPLYVFAGQWLTGPAAALTAWLMLKANCERRFFYGRP